MVILCQIELETNLPIQQLANPRRPAPAYPPRCPHTGQVPLCATSTPTLGPWPQATIAKFAEIWCTLPY